MEDRTGGRNPDWRLTIPDSFLVVTDPAFLKEVDRRVLATHNCVREWVRTDVRETVYEGWYKEDCKKEGALAIAPMVDALHKWRARGEGLIWKRVSTTRTN